MQNDLDLDLDLYIINIYIIYISKKPAITLAFSWDFPLIQGDDNRRMVTRTLVFAWGFINYTGADAWL